MNKNKDIRDSLINIAYTVDVQGQGATQFINQLCASVFSIKKNKKPTEKIKVHIFYGNIIEQVIISLNSIKSDDFDIVFRKISKSDLEFMQKFTKQQPNSQARAWCGIVYARLWLPKLMNDVDKCLYLDSDTLVRGSVQELYDSDLKGKCYGMIMGCIPEYGYNSGVMVMDLKRLRELNLWNDLVEHMRLHAYTYMLPDQTVINRFFKNEITELPLKYNYPPYTDRYRNATGDCDSAVIWHFYNGGTKPYAFVEADWCKVEWNQYLFDADKTMRKNQEAKSVTSNS